MTAGWHVDERRPDRLRWWTGEAWTNDTAHPEAIRRRFALARRWGMVSLLALAAATVALLHLLWAAGQARAVLGRVPADLSLTTDWAAYLRAGGASRVVVGADGQEMVVARADLEAMSSLVSDLSRAGSWVWVPVLVVAISWAPWQHHLAQVLPATTVRWSPEVQGAAWWIPVANLVLPVLTLAELRGRLRDPSARRRVRPDLLLSAWWVGWLGTAVLLPTLLWRWIQLGETGQLRAELGAATPVLWGFVATTLLAFALQLRTTAMGTAYVARLPQVHDHPASMRGTQRLVSRLFR